MSVLVTGSIGIDTIEAPAGRVDCVLGGSAVYFAAAASFFAPVRFVAVAGEDMPEGFLTPLEAMGTIDTSGLEIRRGSATFRWSGRYHDDINHRDTLDVQLGVLAEVGPTIPEPLRDSPYVFLANTHPALQLELIEQLTAPKLIVADTMNLWIENEAETLAALLSRIDGIILNDSEARLLTGETNTIIAADRIRRMVRRFVVVKKGEHGSVLLTDGKIFVLPAYPSLTVVDPTGAGDSFAGAMMGYVADADTTDAATLLTGMAYGTVVASLELEDFSLDKLKHITRADIDERFAEFVTMTRIGAA
ncbi:MAG: PfkB family carbohydrate kinase [Planctomycetota bacterium]